MWNLQILVLPWTGISAQTEIRSFAETETRYSVPVKISAGTEPEPNLGWSLP
jgi:hypothetical protein